MTSQPPPPSGGPGQQDPGSQPPQQPQPGQQPWGQQPPPPGQQAWGQPQGGYGQPAGGGPNVAFDLKRLRLADYVIAGGTLLFLILSWFTWYSLGPDEFFGVDLSVSGWTGSGNVKFAFFLFLLATAWTLLPAVTELRLGFPRSWVTVGLAGLGLVLTLFAWFDTFDFEFSLWALLGVLTAATIVVFAVLTLVPELRGGSTLPGGLANAAQWANRPAQPGPGQSGPGTYGQQPQQPGQPPVPPPPGTQPPYGQPGTPPPPAPGRPDGS